MACIVRKTSSTASLSELPYLLQDAVPNSEGGDPNTLEIISRHLCQYVRGDLQRGEGRKEGREREGRGKERREIWSLV